jgi:leucyl aminopeptidase
MNIHIENVMEIDCVCDALILPVTEGDAKIYDSLGPSVAKAIRKASSKEFAGKRNEVLLIPAPEDIRPERILLAGLGEKRRASAEGMRQAGGRAAAYLRDMGMKKIALSTFAFPHLDLLPMDFIEGSVLGLYTYDRYKSEKKKKKVGSVVILARPSEEIEADLAWTKTVTSSVCFARDLVNAPSNDMTPSQLAKEALSLKRKNLSVKVLERRDAMRAGMGAYLSVAKGSGEPPKFIVLEYEGAREAPLVIIGKAITFDSGGISLKPSEGMEKMKYDMAGGAAVLGVMKAASESKLPRHLIGIIPATENLPGGSASKPGDVVRTACGKSVEIINTDAEGRLVVADAICYAKRFKPRAVIDIATLTGACSVALGSEAIAIMGNDRELLDLFKRAGESTYERVWEMPLFDEYNEYLKSDIADIKNVGGRSGSLVTAAFFLSQFAGEIPWVHLDIAGTAWVEKEKPHTPKGASGVGVRLLLTGIKELK